MWEIKRHQASALQLNSSELKSDLLRQPLVNLLRGKGSAEDTILLDYVRFHYFFCREVTS